MGDLKKHLDGVNDPESPTGEEEELELESKGDEEKPKKEGQTFEQFKREFQRKIDKVNDVVSSIEKTLVALSKPNETPRPTPGHERTLDEMSLAELRQLRQSDDVPNELRGQLDDYYFGRLADEKSSNMAKGLREELKLQQQYEAARKKAVGRYPDLLDESTEFYGLVERALNRYDDEYLARHPETLLNVANEIAVEHNVAPRRKSPRAKPANRHNGPPDEGPTEEEFDEKKHEEISKALRHALPKGKKFNVENIKERQKFYRDNREYMRKV